MMLGAVEIGVSQLFQVILFRLMATF